MNVHRAVAAVSVAALLATLGTAQWDRGRGKLGRREKKAHVTSTDYKRNSKRVSNRGVRLLKVYSKSPCIQGRSWGYTNNRIWVSRGCDADFAYIPRR